MYPATPTTPCPSAPFIYDTKLETAAPVNMTTCQDLQLQTAQTLVSARRYCGGSVLAPYLFALLLCVHKEGGCWLDRHNYHWRVVRVFVRKN